MFGPSLATRGRQICKGYEILSPQKKNVGNGQGFSRLPSLPPPLAQGRVVARFRNAQNAAGLRNSGARIVMGKQHLTDQAGGEFRGPAEPDIPLTCDLHPSGAALHQQVALELGPDHSSNQRQTERWSASIVAKAASSRWMARSRGSGDADAHED